LNAFWYVFCPEGVLYANAMKKLFSLFALLAAFQPMLAQNAASTETTCFNQWQRAFEMRGAFDIKEGWHENVVVSIRNASSTNCFTAKVLVEKNVVQRIFLMYVDGKYELFTPSPKGDKERQQMTISNGMSRPLITIEEDIINVIFPESLKPKKPEFKKAPPPPLDDL
jgi:hypothetical protein